MYCHNENELTSSPLVRFLLVLSLALAAMAAPLRASAADSGDIVVVSTKGEVTFTVNGAERVLRAGSVLEPPAAVRTGRDGAIELKQGATTLSVGPDTLLEFPALETRGAPIDRIIQPRGNVFYDIGKRSGRKLRVETPYLVGVVKGTQFNVAARDEATTISLFEGLLEVRATDDSDVVDLKAGEIASRKRGDKSITVLKMNGERVPPTSRSSGGGGSGDGAPTRDSPPGGTHADNTPRGAPLGTAPRSTPGDVIPVAGGNSGLVAVDVENTRPGLPLTVGAELARGDEEVAVGANVRAANISLNTETSVDLGSGSAAVEVSASASVGNAVDVGASAAVNLDDGVAVAASAAVEAGPVSADVSTGVDLSAAGASAAADVAVSAGVGEIAADVGAGAAVDLAPSGASAAVDLGVAADVGDIAADVGAGTAVDLAPSGAAAAVDLGVAADVGDLAVDVGAGATVDVGSSVDAAADVGVDAGLVAVDAATSVDTGAGAVDLGLGVAGLEVDLGVDLGLDSGSDTTDTGSTTETAPPPVVDLDVDVGGLLDGLLRRPGRR